VVDSDSGASGFNWVSGLLGNQQGLTWNSMFPLDSNTLCGRDSSAILKSPTESSSDLERTFARLFYILLHTVCWYKFDFPPILLQP
jgi:hypothetical protein